MGDTNPVKKLAILGSTGSIGKQTLDIVRALPQHFQVIGLAGGQNLSLLDQQISEFQPKFVHFQDQSARAKLSLKSELLSPEEMVGHPEVDIVVMAVSGTAGLSPTLAAVRAGKKVALANKESMVMAGDILTGEASRYGAQILPVDSEPSAIWQCLQGEKQNVARLVLTASGGPFLHYSSSELEQVTAAQALKHPSWQMGEKVTIDSATLMNKGLEVIEAHWLFNIPLANIEVVIHPQSIVHSMVEFVDGSTKAQLSYPDMHLPIMYALSYPERLSNPQLRRLDWHSLSQLTFEPPDFNRFPCLKLAIAAGQRGGTYPAALCGADEMVVELFLSGHIKFTDIARVIEQTLAEHQNTVKPNLEEIMAADVWAREKVRQLVKGIPC